MSRLQQEVQRLFAADAGGAARAIVVEIGRPADWPRTAALWRAVQAELGWAAPAIAVNGADAFQLWCPFAEPLPAADAGALALALRARFLADLAPARVRLWPVGTAGAAPLPPAVPAEQPDGRWSAFVAADLAPLFAESPWLEIPPGDEAQAGLLAAVLPTKTAARDALLPRPAATAATAAVAAAPAAASAPAPHLPTADPRQFLRAVMADAALPLAQRVDAAKALLAAPAADAGPAEVVGPVQRQLDAYNAHDLERFVAEYHDDVQVFRPPATAPVLAGKAAFAEHYAKNRFTIATLHAALLNRIVAGAVVVDHELITGLGETPLAAAAVYAVDGGRIRTVWFF